MARPISWSDKKKIDCKRNKHWIWLRIKKSCFDPIAIHDGFESKKSECSERGNIRLNWSWLYIIGWLYLPNEMIVLFVLKFIKFKRFLYISMAESAS